MAWPVAAPSADTHPHAICEQQTVLHERYVICSQLPHLLMLPTRATTTTPTQRPRFFRDCPVLKGGRLIPEAATRATIGKVTVLQPLDDRVDDCGLPIRTCTCNPTRLDIRRGPGDPRPRGSAARSRVSRRSTLARGSSDAYQSTSCTSTYTSSRPRLGRVSRAAQAPQGDIEQLPELGVVVEDLRPHA